VPSCWGMQPDSLMPKRDQKRCRHAWCYQEYSTIVSSLRGQHTPLPYRCSMSYFNPMPTLMPSSLRIRTQESISKSKKHKKQLITLNSLEASDHCTHLGFTHRTFIQSWSTTWTLEKAPAMAGQPQPCQALMAFDKERPLRLWTSSNEFITNKPQKTLSLLRGT